MLALMLADSRTPTGGYAHSGGLEAALEAGLTAHEVPAFMAARLSTVGLTDAAVAAAACGETAVDGLRRLDDEIGARTPSPPLRAASRQLGRALLRLALRVWPDDGTIARYAAVSAPSPRPVALGTTARAAGLVPQEAARLSLYEDAAGVAAAALKLLPLDPAEVTVWVAGLAPLVEDLAQHAAACAPDDLPSAATPLLDLRALRHSTATRRLFVS
jgi:urease accessory protein